MENLGFGQILLLIVFILLPLGNFVMQRVRRRLEDKIPAEESPRRRFPATPKQPRRLRQSLVRRGTESLNCSPQLFPLRLPGVILPSDRFYGPRVMRGMESSS